MAKEVINGNCDSASCVAVTRSEDGAAYDILDTKTEPPTLVERLSEKEYEKRLKIARDTIGPLAMFTNQAAALGQFTPDELRRFAGDIELRDGPLDNLTPGACHVSSERPTPVLPPSPQPAIIGI